MPSHNACCAARIASSVTSTTRSTCACAIGNISSPTWRGASESAATLPGRRVDRVARLERLDERRCALGLDRDDARRRTRTTRRGRR